MSDFVFMKHPHIFCETGFVVFLCIFQKRGTTWNDKLSWNKQLSYNLKRFGARAPF